MDHTLAEIERELSRVKATAERAAEGVAALAGGGKANAALLQDRRMSKAAPAAGNYLGWNATTHKWEPVAPVILIATATATLTLTATAQSVVGDGDSTKVRLLLPTIGTWLVEATCDFLRGASDPGEMIGELFVNDSASAESGACVFDSQSTNERATVAQRWTVTTTVVNTPVELKGRSAISNSATLRQPATRMTAFAVVGGTTGGGGANHDLLSTIHPDTLAAAVSRGSITVGNSTPAWAELVLAAVGKVLRSDGTDAVWAEPLDLTKTTLTIDANDEIVVPITGWVYVAAASGTADNLDGIGAGRVDGQVVFLTPDAGDDITLIHNGTVTSGKKLMINGEANVVMDEDHDVVIAVFDAVADVWNIIAPGSGGGGGGGVNHFQDMLPLPGFMPNQATDDLSYNFPIEFNSGTDRSTAVAEITQMVARGRLASAATMTFRVHTIASDDGTSTGITATTLTDTGQAWTVDEWIGAVVTDGTNSMVVTSNTATVLTGASWSPSTPSSPIKYVITDSQFNDSITVTAGAVRSVLTLGTPRTIKKAWYFRLDLTTGSNADAQDWVVGMIGTWDS